MTIMIYRFEMPFFARKDIRKIIRKFNLFDSHGFYLISNDRLYYTGRFDKPKTRVKRALERLSRDRWIGPRELSITLDKLAKLAVGNYKNTGMLKRYSIKPECLIVGMFGGEPIAYKSEYFYNYAIQKVQKIVSKNDASIYLLMIDLEIKRIIENGKKTNKQY